jgi:DNA polymerase-3 subunit alpha
MEAVVAARGDTVRRLADFATRVDPRQLNKMQIENLVRAGAFDGSTQPRPPVRRRRNDPAPRPGPGGGKGSGQIGLFGGGRGSKPEPLRLPDMPDWPLERLAFEAEAIGFHLTAHPLDAYAALLRRLGVVPSNQLQIRAEPPRPRLAGRVKRPRRLAWWDHRTRWAPAR